MGVSSKEQQLPSGDLQFQVSPLMLRINGALLFELHALHSLKHLSIY